ncbi:MAG: AzlD domain-containing protein [Betaproteobacteria bacterium]|nr:AzlD domain-containing protein [Betaproteobacteria bacterium]
MNDVWVFLTVLALGVVTLVTRCCFFILNHALPFPRWANRGLRYAPIAALSAVIVPEIVVKHGVIISDWRDARIYAAAVGAAFYFWRRGQGQAVLGTIVVGMAVYLPLHIAWGW